MSFKSVRNEVHLFQVLTKFSFHIQVIPVFFPVYCDMSNGGEFKVILSLA